VINTNLHAILHRLRDIAFEMSTNRYVWLPLLRLNPATEGFLLDDLRKIFSECQRMAKDQCTKWRRKIAANFNRLSRVHERYRQSTDRCAIAYSERERLEFTFAKNGLAGVVQIAI